MRPSLLLLVVLLSGAAAWPVWALDERGRDLVDCKITLPNGAIYMRGETDPVAELVVGLTLTNRSAKENLGKEIISDVKRVSMITEEERLTLENTNIEAKDIAEYRQKLAEIMEAFDKKKTQITTIERTPVNPKSYGIEYISPRLGPNDLVEFVITRVPHEGEKIPEGAKVKLVERDMAVEHTGRMDFVPNKYLVAGESSEEYKLPVGKFYKVREPGSYKIKAVIRTIGDSGKPEKVVESNEETFSVVPFKVVSRKIEHMVEFWDDFERGHPDFDYMVYQVPRAAPWNEVYYVQRIKVRGMERWEWHRLCSVKDGTTAQVAQVTPTKLAVLAHHAKGDAAVYTVDFAKVDPLVTYKKTDLKDGKLPTLKVEGGNVSAE